MKPLRIELSHFGPFTAHEVDLEPFRDEGLFLIHGDTGAGKSTLLDAMSFALYGKGLGARGGDDLLRSRAAAPADATRASLTFALGERVFRVTRSTEYERPGKGGTVKQRPEALLECLHGDARFEPVSSSKKVTAAVESLLGLAHEQFARIIVLPQGEFRDLLLARADERERILEHLFGSAIFGGVEAQLRAMDREVEVDEARLRGALRTVAQTQGVTDLASVQALLESLDGQTAEAEARAAALRDEAARRAEQARLAREAEAHRRRRDELLRERDALEPERAEVASLRARLALAERAAPCAAAARAVSQERDDAEAAAQRADAARAELAALHQQIADEALTPSRIDALEAEAIARREDRDRLLPLRRDAEEAARVRDAIARDRAALDDAAARAVEAARAAEARGVERDARATTLAAERAALAEGTPSTRARVESIEARLEAARAREALALTVREAERAARELKRAAARAGEGAVAAREALDDAERARLRSMAAALAAGLTPGSPCPVCGSGSHPAPAVSDDARLDPAAVEAAREAARGAEQARATAEAAWARADGEVEALRAQLRDATAGEAAEAVELESALDLARSELRAMQRRQSLSDEAQRALDALDARAARDEREAQRLLAERDALRAKVDAQEGRFAELLARLGDVEADALGEALSSAEAAHAEAEAAWEAARRRRAALEARRGPLQTRVTSEARSEEDALRRLRGAEETLTEALRASGFDDVEAAARASLDPAARARLEARATATEAAALRLDAALEAHGASPPLGELDAATLEARAAEARAAADSAREHLGSQVARRAELTRASERLGELSRELAEKAPRWDAVRSVAAAVNGRAAGRTRLSRFVLIDAFERVVACASARLDVISDGRFRLHRRDLRQAGREFELAVTDSYHGAGERPAASLSGGEMFLASLAMALGLSDVLQAASGGVHLESLFVDEGFGSLDEESLDKAVAVLEQLRARSRLVGVVSHVAEMRRRIPARLEVLRADGGSVTRTAIRAHHRALGEAKP